MDDLELLRRLGIALAIGLLTGLERGWKRRDEEAGQRAAGLRTFALVGLLGGFSGLAATQTGPVVLGFIFLGFTAAFGVFQWLDARQEKDVSATTMVAGLLTFVLAADAVLGSDKVAASGAVAMVLLLAAREPLHHWLERLKREEIRAVLILLAMSFLLLPVLPNRPVDPWGAINPAEIWLLAIMIASISFGGYVAVRLFGDRLGVVMAAIVGGLASSTATTLTLARLGADKPESARLLSAGILASGTVMVIRVAVVATLLNRSLLRLLIYPLGAAAIVMAAASIFFLFGEKQDERPQLEMNNPLELGTAIKLAGLIAVVMLATEVVQEYIGKAGVLIIAAFSGIADVDAVTISMSRLGGASVALETAVLAIALAVGVNTVSKAIMAGSVGGRRIGRLVGSASALAVAAGTAAALLV
jgi:uncharacterized membrane protein (DUF4010 family)